MGWLHTRNWYRKFKKFGHRGRCIPYDLCPHPQAITFPSRHPLGTLATCGWDVVEPRCIKSRQKKALFLLKVYHHPGLDSILSFLWPRWCDKGGTRC